MNLRHLRVMIAASGISIAPIAAAMPEAGPDLMDALSRMSLEELSNVEVTSVSKSAQSLATAPASIYVITREEILRAGVLSIPEALRLAPNMQVTQLTSSGYQIGARGLAGAPDSQNFSNKILILIDGRSVYSPLFSGIEYDMQDVLMDDIERIEVISGPGATLWGANAMHGVINIITRNARESQGVLLRADAGAEEQGVSARYGGKLGADGGFRVYGKWFDRGETELDGGAGAEDDWRKVQIGFRGDLARDGHSFTFQGDYQDASQSQLDAENFGFHGGNVLGRWEHAGERVHTRVQAFYDSVHRGAGVSGIAFEIDTYDVEFQQSATLGSRHSLIWGAGRRHNSYETVNTALAFVPDHRTLELTNVFLQDVIQLGQQFKLTAGIKLEDHTFTDWELLPDLRLSWTPNEQMLVWLAGSRAIRAPTPFDVDVQEFLGGGLFLRGNPDFKPEKVTAFELGIRAQPDARLSISASAFYNEYDDLRSIEITPVTLLPLTWGNLIEGSAYGVEAWANLQVAPWWRLSPGFRSLHKRLEFSPGAAGLVSLNQAGNDVTSSYVLKSSMIFGAIGMEAIVRKVGSMPEPQTDDYTDLHARVSWQVNEQLELAVKGFNLLNETHREFAAPQGREIRRSVLAEVRYAF
jgi:iron complex outermembrane receptor protein